MKHPRRVAYLFVLLAVWAADLLAALIVLPHPLTTLNTLDVGAGLNEGLFRGGKYLFLGAALAWVNRLAEPALRHYALAGGASSLIAVLLTFVVCAGDLRASAQVPTQLGHTYRDWIEPVGYHVEGE